MFAQHNTRTNQPEHLGRNSWQYEHERSCYSAWSTDAFSHIQVYKMMCIHLYDNSQTGFSFLFFDSGYFHTLLLTWPVPLDSENDASRDYHRCVASKCLHFADITVCLWHVNINIYALPCESIKVALPSTSMCLNLHSPVVCRKWRVYKYYTIFSLKRTLALHNFALCFYSS